MDNKPFLTHLADLRDHIKTAVEARQVLYPLVADLIEEFEADVRCTYTGLDLRMVGDGKTFKRLYAALRNRGLKRNWVTPGQGTVGAMFNADSVGARVYITMSFPQCRVVQVGTKEVPIYETQCAGTPMPAEDQLEAA